MPRRGENIQKKVETRKRAGGSTYEIERWVSTVDLGVDSTTGNRQRQFLSADTYGDVKKLRRTLLEQRDRGVRVAAGKGKTVGSWCTHWVETTVRVELAEGTYKSYASDIDLHVVKSPIGGRPLNKLAPEEVRSWLALLVERHLGDGTRRRILTVLRKALQMAVRDGLISRNVASKEFVDAPTVRRGRATPLSDAQARQLLRYSRSAADLNYPMWLVFMHSALREGELLGLRWAGGPHEEGVDLEAGVIRVRTQLTRYRKRKLGQALKREASLRDVPLNTKALQALRDQHVAVLKLQLLAGSSWQEHNLVFPTRDGLPQRNNNVWLKFKRVLKRAGLPTTFTIHDLRSTAASSLINVGATLYDVSKYLGHSDIKTTADEYGHLFVERRQALADILAEQLDIDRPHALGGA
jgi:integrase